jgi:hypothetical protein
MNSVENQRAKWPLTLRMQRVVSEKKVKPGKGLNYVAGALHLVPSHPARATHIVAALRLIPLWSSVGDRAISH